jgi:hypothetical protein
MKQPYTKNDTVAEAIEKILLDAGVKDQNFINKCKLRFMPGAVDDPKEDAKLLTEFKKAIAGARYN